MKRDEPLVSVILPTHDRGPVLARAMRSVLAQTHRSLELIVVDDASSDDTRAVVAQFGDPRVRYLRQEQRRGPAAARNRGIRAAAGPLLAFQDSDDEWLTTKLERQLALLNECGNGTALVLASYVIVEPGGARLVRSQPLIHGERYEADLLTGHPVATPLWLARRDVVIAAGLFDETMPCLEDWDLALRVAARGHLRALPDVALVKHGHLGTISADRQRHGIGLRAIHDRHTQFFRRNPKAEATLLAELGRLECRYGSRRHGIAALARALKLEPWRPVRYKALLAALAGRAAWRDYLRQS